MLLWRAWYRVHPGPGLDQLKQGRAGRRRAAKLSRCVVPRVRALLAQLDPPAPILVGLSIGGLFAAQAYLAGAPAIGLVLINTLRKPSQRLEWINQAMVRLARLGGGLDGVGATADDDEGDSRG